MSEPYLILHKVRGEPAFDIAHKLQIGDEEGWVLSACGYRAYPWDSIPLSELGQGNGMIYNRISKTVSSPMPDDWPDLFACNDRPLREETYAVKAKAAGLLQSLGLIKKIERRL